MKWLSGLALMLVLILTFCVISCGDDDDDDDSADDTDDDNVDDDDDNIDDDDIDDDDDDDVEKELVVDDGTYEGCFSPGFNDDLVGNIFDPSGPADLIRIKMIWTWGGSSGDMPTDPPPMSVYIYDADPETGPMGPAIAGQVVDPLLWDTWESYELDLPVAVGTLTNASQFVLAVGRSPSNERSYIAADYNADPTPEWFYYDETWHKPTATRAYMIRAIILQ